MKPIPYIPFIALLLVLAALMALGTYETEKRWQPAPAVAVLCEASGPNDAYDDSVAYTNNVAAAGQPVDMALALRELRESDRLVPSDPPPTLRQVREWITNDIHAAEDLHTGFGSMPAGFSDGVYAAKAEDLRLLARVPDAPETPPDNGKIAALVHAIDDGIQTTCINKAMADHDATNSRDANAVVRAIYYQGVLDTERSLRGRVADLLPHMAVAQPTVQDLPPLRLRFGDRFWRPGWVVASNGVAVAYEWNIGDETVRVEAMPRGTNQ